MLNALSRVTLVVFVVAVAVFSHPAYLSAAEPGKSSGTAVDDAYAAKLWSYMVTNKLVGEGRIRSFPFVGSRPHGSIQEVIATKAVIDGQEALRQQRCGDPALARGARRRRGNEPGAARAIGDRP